MGSEVALRKGSYGGSKTVKLSFTLAFNYEKKIIFFIKNISFFNFLDPLCYFLKKGGAGEGQANLT